MAVAPLVDPATKVWLKSDGNRCTVQNGSLPAGLQASAIVQEIMSPLAVKADATTEATRQMGIVAGPLARDIHVVPGARRDLMGKCIQLQGSYLDYAAAVTCFVVGVNELEDSTTELTVIRKLV